MPPAGWADVRAAACVAVASACLVAAVASLSGCGGGVDGGGATPVGDLPAQVTVDGKAFTLALVEVEPGSASVLPAVSIESVDRRGVLAGSWRTDLPMGFVRDSGVVVALPPASPSFPFSEPLGIGDDGVVVGRASDCALPGGAAELSFGFVWRRGDPSLTRVVMPDSVRPGPPQCPGYNSTVPSDGNARGTLVGEYVDAGGVRRAFIGPVDALARYELPPRAGVALEVGLRAINVLGEVVGDLVDAAGVRRAFVDGSGGFSFVDVPGAVWSVARDITDAGVIGGYFEDGQSRVIGFVVRDGRVASVAIPGADYTRVNGVSDTGLIVGTVQFQTAAAEHRTRGFVLAPLGQQGQ